MSQDFAHAFQIARAHTPGLTNASIATSRSGTQYLASRVRTSTHILDIPSELAALVRASHANEYLIESVETIVDNAAQPVSPLVLKILIDHAVRTGIQMDYTLRDSSGALIYECDDVRFSLPFYKSPLEKLSILDGRDKSHSVTPVNRQLPIQDQLRTAAREGIARNFPVRDKASGYGAAALTTSGIIHFGGQYSTPDERLGVHAEMGVLIAALFAHTGSVTHIGVMSSKHESTVCSMCGSCRQFIADLSALHGWSPELYLFASGSDRYVRYSLSELLPVQWASTK